MGYDTFFRYCPWLSLATVTSGIHDASWSELVAHYSRTPRRQDLLIGLEKALANLFGSGCPQIFLDGSFVTAKPFPGDYELVWDARFVDPTTLDPIFLDFTYGTVYQKQKYMGEFFPSTYIEAGSGKPFLDFFQLDKDTGEKKGIIRLHNHLKTGGVI